MFKLSDLDVEAEEFHDPVVYREWGIRFAKTQKFLACIDAFEKAIKLSPKNDLRAILGLARAQSKFTRYSDAIENAKKALKIAPDNYKAKFMMVSTLFKIGEFGYSLIHAYQGMKNRRTPFEWGVYQGNEAVENCIGRNVPPKALQRIYPWIRDLLEYRQKLIAKLGEEKDELEGIQEDEAKFKVNDPEAQREYFVKRLYRVIARMVLGSLADDKFFPENILEHPEWMRVPNEKSTAQLHHIIKKTFMKSSFRQDVMRTRKPLYVTLLKRREIPQTRKAVMKKNKQLLKKRIIIEADFLLNKLHKTRLQRDYIRFFSHVDRIKEKFDSYSPTVFPRKDECLKAMYRMVAWTYLDTRNISTLLDEESKEIFIMHHLGIQVSALPRPSDIGWVPCLDKRRTMKVFRRYYQPFTVDYRDPLRNEIHFRRLAMASDPLELAWLYHEFAKYTMEIKRMDLARFYSKRARETAKDINCEAWVLNAHHLTIRMDILALNKNEAQDAAELALLSAKRLGIDYLVEFYERTIELLDDPLLDGHMVYDGIAVRRKQMLDLMPEDMKNDVDFLLRSMEAVPATRRLSIMPGYTPVDQRFDIPCMRNSIIPAKKKNSKTKAVEKILREHDKTIQDPFFVDFDKYA